MTSEKPKPAPRYREPERRQVQLNFTRTFDELIDELHPARTIWTVVSSMNLSRFGSTAKAREGHVGRAALSPAMLLTLWLYGISRGIGSAREIARLTMADDAFKWIVGDLDVSHNKLSEFRVGHGDALKQLMIDLLAMLVHRELLELEHVAQDGTRVRASASAPSFRSKASLEECREQAELHLRVVLQQASDPEISKAQHAARVAKAMDYKRRVEGALQVVAELAEKPKRKSEPRASTTDPEARVMKMADGGFRPAYNVQLAVDGSPLGGPLTIVGLEVTNVGSDMGAIAPMVELVEGWTERRAKNWLADANHGRNECIEECARRGINLVMPVNKRSKTPRPKTAKPSPAVQAFRDKMLLDENKRLYKARASIVELVNAAGKHRLALNDVTVRGSHKVWCFAMLNALTFNVLSHASALVTT